LSWPAQSNQLVGELGSTTAMENFVPSAYLWAPDY